MSLESVGAFVVLIGLMLVVYGYLIASARIDELERQLNDQREDRAVPVWSRRPLYDWSERGDFS